ncbi:hypothetical protein AXG93_4421s1060 [Marchantia polymorpha subsp. ruderalis]|uniref:Uncharacterized protein n=1 Tax=Marchantia polymorpha subsp. ruderalis TaxID=1480154 RepID=A0A176WI27_MARPO|nr:hypothetical protein AXG93_4421s1060 [Marchantia polymorpha subsp. ruderalis]
MDMSFLPRGTSSPSSLRPTIMFECISSEPRVNEHQRKALSTLGLGAGGGVSTRVQYRRQCLALNGGAKREDCHEKQPQKKKSKVKSEEDVLGLEKGATFDGDDSENKEIDELFEQEAGE